MKHSEKAKKYHCKVTVVKKAPGPEDGDTYYPSPAGYTTQQKDVTYGEVKTLFYDSTTTGKQRRLKVVLPPNYSEEKQYPVMYLLHGLGQDDTDWINAKAPTIIGNMIHNGTAKEMILVLPNCRARANDAANPSDAFSLSNYQAFDNFINDLRDNVMGRRYQYRLHLKGKILICGEYGFRKKARHLSLLPALISTR